MKHHLQKVCVLCLLISTMILFSTNVLANEEGHGTGDSHAHVIHWGYTGEGAPEHWDELTKGGVCNIGHAQSPIQISGTVSGNLSEIAFNYGEALLSIVNNGHTIQADVKHGHTMTYDGVRYKLLQFHFHHPSEHIVDGVKALMEAHFVHVDPLTGKLAVIGVLLTLDESANDAYGQVFDRMLSAESQTFSYDLNAFLPEDHGYMTYEGSLTTPPCSEIVRWLVLAEPIGLSQQQIDAFASLYPMNAREPQELYGRKVLGSN